MYILLKADAPGICRVTPTTRRLTPIKPLALLWVKLGTDDSPTSMGNLPTSTGIPPNFDGFWTLGSLPRVSHASDIPYPETPSLATSPRSHSMGIAGYRWVAVGLRWVARCITVA